MQTIPYKNIYRADLEVVKGYRSGSTINKAYRSGELIYYKLNYPEPTPPGPGPEETPLTFNIISSGTINWKAYSSSYTKDIQYSVNDGPWSSITSSTGGTPISLNTGDVVRFKGDGAISTGSSAYNTFCGSTAIFEASGNVASLIDSTNYATVTTVAAHSFRYLFQEVTGLTSAENLVLQATTLGQQCYFNMFAGCTSLTTAPELPATTLANYCYRFMFYGCSSLNYIKCLATDISASLCTDGWVNGVAATGTFVKDANTTWTTGASGIPDGWTVEDYGPYKEMPLTFDIVSGGNIVWSVIGNTAASRTIEYKKNDGNWTSITSDSGASAATIAVVSGDKVQFRGNNAAYAVSNTQYSTFMGNNTAQTTASFNIYGNIMSLINSTGFTDLQLTSANTYAFCGLFKQQSTAATSYLISAEHLVLPSNTADHCYRALFANTSLEVAPKLPATALSQYCYYYMFQNNRLTTAPALPATTLEPFCYSNMFYGCTSLTSAPELPATALAFNCYFDMFMGCTSLINAPELPATTLSVGCYTGMFYGCTSLTTAPELPATTLTNGCYQNMFRDCTSLNYIKCLATNSSADNYTSNWAIGVAATGTFVTPSSTNWTTGSSGIPSGWTRVDA